MTPDADAEEIKAAYRRLSKTYHPDTTSLPLELAAERFVRLKEAYTVLSSEEERRLYDWQLAKKLAPPQGGPLSYPSDNGKTMADDGSRIAKVHFYSCCCYERFCPRRQAPDIYTLFLYAHPIHICASNTYVYKR